MIGVRGLILVGALAATVLAWAPEAGAQVLLANKCSVVLQASWVVTREDSAARDRSTIRLFPAPDQLRGIRMSGPGFRQIHKNATRVVLLNAWRDGTTQLRSITDSEPACIADAIVPRGVSSDSARKIVDSLTRVPTAPNRALAQ